MANGNEKESLGLTPQQAAILMASLPGARPPASSPVGAGGPPPGIGVGAPPMPGGGGGGGSPMLYDARVGGMPGMGGILPQGIKIPGLPQPGAGGGAPGMSAGQAPEAFTGAASRPGPQRSAPMVNTQTEFESKAGRKGAIAQNVTTALMQGFTAIKQKSFQQRANQMEGAIARHIAIQQSLADPNLDPEAKKVLQQQADAMFQDKKFQKAYEKALKDPNSAEYVGMARGQQAALKQAEAMQKQEQAAAAMQELQTRMQMQMAQKAAAEATKRKEEVLTEQAGQVTPLAKFEAQSKLDQIRESTLAEAQKKGITLVSGGPYPILKDPAGSSWTADSVKDAPATFKQPLIDAINAERKNYKQKMSDEGWKMATAAGYAASRAEKQAERMLDRQAFAGFSKANIGRATADQAYALQDSNFDKAVSGDPIAGSAMIRAAIAANSPGMGGGGLGSMAINRLEFENFAKGRPYLAGLKAQYTVEGKVGGVVVTKDQAQALSAEVKNGRQSAYGSFYEVVHGLDASPEAQQKIKALIVSPKGMPEIKDPYDVTPSGGSQRNQSPAAGGAKVLVEGKDF